MTFLRGTVGILCWPVLLIAGFFAVMSLLAGEVAVAIVAGLVAWGAWLLLQRMVEAE